MVQNIQQLCIGGFLHHLWDACMSLAWPVYVLLGRNWIKFDFNIFRQANPSLKKSVNVHRKSIVHLTRGIEFLQEYVLCEVPKGFVMILMSIH